MVENVIIRELKTADADDITTIFEEITQAPVSSDFKKLIEQHARRKQDACLVAEFEGKPIDDATRRNVATFIILFLYGVGAFDIPFLLSESNPGMISIRVYNLYFRRDLANRPEAMAMLVAMFVFSLIFIWAYTRVVERLKPSERKL